MRKRFKKGKKIFLISLIIILLVIIPGLFLIYWKNRDDRSKDTRQDLDLIDGALQHEFNDFGPGRIEIDACKVLTSWESKRNFSAELWSSKGEVLYHSEGTFTKEIGEENERSHWNYFKMKETWQVNDKDDYSLRFYGLRKNSRDHLRVTAVNSYNVGKSDFYYDNGTFCYMIKEEDAAGLGVSVVKTFPGGAQRDPILAEIIDDEGNCIASQAGYFVEGESLADRYGDPFEDNDDEYDDGYTSDNDWFAYLIIGAIFYNSKDSYVINAHFDISEEDECTLRLSGLRRNSGDQYGATIDRDPYIQEVLVVEGRDFYVDDVVDVVTSSIFLSTLLFIVTLIILIGLIYIMKFYTSGGFRRTRSSPNMV